MKKASLGFFKKYFSLKAIILNAFIGALYLVITIACAPLSYNFIQFRFSEALMLLVFFNPSYTLGLTIGCYLSNLAFGLGILDQIFGTLATFVSCLLIILFSKFIKNLFFSSLIPSLVNAAVVPFVIIFSSFNTPDAFTLDLATYFMMFGFILLGEVVAISVVGYPLIYHLSKKYNGFYNLILATRNKEYRF